MAIDKFSKQQFEDALPIHNKTGKQLWEYAGFIQGEHCYNVIVAQGIKIHIRSSIDNSGYAADTGQDSIRIWLIGDNGKPLGGKLSKWVTRVNGWDTRMTEQLRTFWELARKSGYCPKCLVPRSIYKVKKAGPNIGRQFCKCNSCGNNFEWLT